MEIPILVGLYRSQANPHGSLFISFPNGDLGPRKFQCEWVRTDFTMKISKMESENAGVHYLQSTQALEVLQLGENLLCVEMQMSTSTTSVKRIRVDSLSLWKKTRLVGGLRAANL